MSNPAVFELNKTIIRNNIFTIEDNIGEAIHFHIGLVRLDLSVKEFNDISSKLINILNKQINIPDFNLNNQDEYFLEKIASSIPYILDVVEDTIAINELKYRFENINNEIVETKVVFTPVYEYYLGNKDIINRYVFKREIWQTKEELFESIKLNNTIYIDENNYILDGYKNICFKLAKKTQEDTVKVKKIIFSKNKIPNIILKMEKKEW